MEKQRSSVLEKNLEENIDNNEDYKLFVIVQYNKNSWNADNNNNILDNKKYRYRMIQIFNNIEENNILMESKILNQYNGKLILILDIKYKDPIYSHYHRKNIVIIEGIAHKDGKNNKSNANKKIQNKNKKELNLFNDAILFKKGNFLFQ